MSLAQPQNHEVGRDLVAQLERYSADGTAAAAALARAHATWAGEVYARWRRGDAGACHGLFQRRLVDLVRRLHLVHGHEEDLLLVRILVDVNCLAAEDELRRHALAPDPGAATEAVVGAAIVTGRDTGDGLDDQRAVRAQWVWAQTQWHRGERVSSRHALALLRDLVRLAITAPDGAGLAARLRSCARHAAADLLELDRVEDGLRAHRRVLAALQAMPRPPVEEIVEQRREFAQLAMDGGRPEVAVELLESALIDASTANRADLHTMLVDALLRSRRTEAATRHMELLLHELSEAQAAQPHDVQVAYDRAWWSGRLVEVLADAGRTREALPWARSALHFAERLALRHGRDPWTRVFCAWQTAWLAHLFVDLGRQRPAGTWLRRAGERATALPRHEAERDELLAWIHRLEGGLWAVRGDLHRAEDSLRRALTLAADAQPTQWKSQAWALEDLARLCARRGRDREALELVGRAIQIWTPMPQDRRAELARCLRLAAELRTACGEVDAAWLLQRRADELDPDQD